MAKTGKKLDMSSPNDLPLLGLAPMEGVTCLATRLWLALAGGFDFAMTPFLRVTKDYPSRRIPSTFAAESVQWKNLLGELPYEIIPQLMGQTVQDLVPIAESLLVDVPFVDFNCGCPSPTVVGNGAGSSLLRSPDVFENYLSQLSRALGANRMSIKMRLGFNESEEFKSLSEVASQFSLAQLTVHGRTRAQRYRGHAVWQPIKDALNLGLCVVGSGDVLSAPTFQERCNLANPPKVLVGRGALRNPFVFHEIRNNKPVIVSRDIFAVQLKVALLLHSLFELKPTSLLEWMQLSFPFLQSPGHDLSLWHNCFDELRSFSGRALSDQKSDFQFEGLQVPKGCYFKLKMIWNYLRTSLPTAALDATCLRAQSPNEFFVALEAIVRTLPAFFEVRHRPEYDWVFSGGGKSNGNCETEIPIDSKCAP
jgi:tRNA-dihydrouridine synthase